MVDKTLPKSKVLVTGATGFLGRHVVKTLQEDEWDVIETSKTLGFDLRNEAEVLTLGWITKPDVVVHLAKQSFTEERSAQDFRDTLSMGLNVLQMAALSKAKVVMVAPSSCYSIVGEPVIEKDFPCTFGMDGYSNAKRALLSACDAYGHQYGLEYRFLVMSELYGPSGKARGKMQSVDSLLTRAVLARAKKETKIVLPGDGTQERQPLFVQDAACAIAHACDFERAAPIINVPGGTILTEKDLAALCAKISGFSGEIAWDPEAWGLPQAVMKPGGMAKKALDWEPEVPLQDGLLATLEWLVPQLVEEAASAT